MQNRQVVLVTGAAGKTGRAVTRALAGRGVHVRALVRRAEQESTVLDLGAREVVAGDMRDVSVWEKVVVDVNAIYHICPNMAPDEQAIGEKVVSAASRCGAPRFVLHSVLHPQTEAMPHHWNKLRVEEMLLASGLPWTLLQPGPYMQNVFAGWASIARSGVLRLPYAPEARFSMVDLADVGQAAARVIVDGGFEGGTYELCGPAATDHLEVAQTLGQTMGRPVRVEQVTLEQWEKEARSAGLGPYACVTLRAMFGYYDRHGLVGNGAVLGWLLGRPPATFAEAAGRFVREVG